MQPQDRFEASTDDMMSTALLLVNLKKQFALDQAIEQKWDQQYKTGLKLL